MNPVRNRNTNLLFFALSCLFSFFQHHGIVRLMDERYIGSVEAAQGVIAGYPHWRVYQNRILGPYMIDWISQFTPSFLFAHFLFSLVTFALAGYLACLVGYRIRNVATGLLAFFAFQSTFSLAFDKNWFYAWDSLDLIVFFVFALFVVLEKPWVWFVGLFGVAIFNRESAQFIALWLIVDPLVRKAVSAVTKTGARLDWKPLSAGIVCLLLSVWIVEWLRTTLLVEETGFRLWNILPGQLEFGPNFHFRLFDNIDALMTKAFSASYALPLFPWLLLLSIAAAAVLAALRLRGKFISLAILQCAMLAGLLLFALVYETRVFIQMIPFLVLSVTALAVDAGDRE